MVKPFNNKKFNKVEYKTYPSGRVEVKFHKKPKNFKGKRIYKFVDYDGNATNLEMFLDKNGQVYDVNPRTAFGYDLFNKFYGRPYAAL